MSRVQKMKITNVVATATITTPTGFGDGFYQAGIELRANLGTGDPEAQIRMLQREAARLAKVETDRWQARTGALYEDGQ